MVYLYNLLSQLVLIVGSALPLYLIKMLIDANVYVKAVDIGIIYIVYLVSIMLVGIGVQWIKPDEDLEIYDD